MQCKQYVNNIGNVNNIEPRQLISLLNNELQMRVLSRN